MAVQTNDEIKGTEKEFLDLFNHLCYSRTAWQVWSDLMSAMACTIANVFETNPKRKADREKEYERCIKELGGDVEIPAKLFAIVTMALENNPDQDFLGKLYMQLNLGSHWHGQFFTPYIWNSNQAPSYLMVRNNVYHEIKQGGRGAPPGKESNGSGGNVWKLHSCELLHGCIPQRPLVRQSHRP